MTKELVNKINWTPLWDGVESPHVFSDGQKTYLIYKVATIDEKNISEFKRLTHDGEDWRFIALVTFDKATFRFGIANDEVWQGLAYYGQGIGTAQIIENSKWIEEVKQIHKIHPYYDEGRWKDLKHYVLLFKEEMFEVLATRHTIEIFETTIDRVGQEIINRMNFGE